MACEVISRGAKQVITQNFSLGGEGKGWGRGGEGEGVGTDPEAVYIYI